MKWIEGKFTDDDRRYNDRSYKCSNCGYIMDYPTRFCPDCGEQREEIKKKNNNNMNIKIGDEVLFNWNIFVVTRIYSNKKYCELLAWDGNPLSDVLTNHIIKTGRHFPIECILEDMRETMRQHYG